MRADAWVSTTIFTEVEEESGGKSMNTQETPKVGNSSYLTVLFALLPITLGLLIYWTSDETGGDKEYADLVIISYSSFLNEWGPGPQLSKIFEDKYNIKIKWIDAGDAGLILERMRFQSQRNPIDIVIGLDQLNIEEARNISEWRNFIYPDVLWHRNLPKDALERDFVPFDWGPLAFVYKEGEVVPPMSLQDLLSKKYTKAISLQDPRTSTPGLQFLYWVLTEEGLDEGFDFLENLSSSVHSISTSWSTSYGLFKKGQAKLTFSYITSPVYHKVEEKSSDYRAAIFSDGHPYQVEYMGIPENCKNCELAEIFVRFLLEPESQKIIMEKNYMLPVLDQVEVNTPFADVPDVSLIPFSAQSLTRDRRSLLERWKQLGL